MRVLLIGGGGREHALAWRIAASPRVKAFYASPGSAAIAAHATCLELTGPGAIEGFAASEKIGLVVIGPEAPLVAGLADRLAERGIPAFGPSAGAARLEGSKAFAKAFMKRHAIPTAAYETFTQHDDALAYLARAQYPLVVKADGLAAGKGVIICPDLAAGQAALRTIMTERAFGDAGGQVVIESFLRGEEASFFVVSDGKDFVVLPSAQDHKTIGELDQGPNTGGMGAYCPAPVVTPEVERRVIEEIVRPTLRGMAAEGHPYRGALYVGLMIDQGAPKVVEYNCRFGDPECQPLMMMLDSDLLDLLEAAATGRLAGMTPRWRGGAAACIVMASGGYPGDYPKGLAMEGLQGVKETPDCRVFHAGTSRDNGEWRTQGGRVLGVTAWGRDLSAALARGYRAVEAIHWPGATYRRDIGLKGLRRDAAGRAAVSVAVLMDPGGTADASLVTRHLARLGLAARAVTADSRAAPLREALRECEEAGVEVFIALGGAGTTFARSAASLTERPVIAAPLNQTGQGMAEAAVAAARLLAIKYPDVHAAVRRWTLEQEHSGSAATLLPLTPLV